MIARLAFVALFLFGCGSTPSPPPLPECTDAGTAPPCMATAPTSCPDPAPDYSDVEPIFIERCQVCHDGQHGEWPLATYGHVADWSDSIRSRMLSCTMPPVDSCVTMPLEERQRILESGMALLDGGADRREQLDRRRRDPPDLGVHGGVAEVGAPADSTSSPLY